MPSVSDVVAYTRLLVWDPDTLVYTNMFQPIIDTDTLTIGNPISVNNFPTTQAVNPSPFALTHASGEVSGSGNNTLITPSSGKRVRLYYASWNPNLAVEGGFRFGASGTLFLRNKLVAGGSVIAKDFGDFRFVQGAIDEALVLNLSLAVSTIWNAFYVEV